MSGHQSFAALGIHVEANRGVFGGEQTGEWQAYIAEANDTDFDVLIHVCDFEI